VKAPACFMRVRFGPASTPKEERKVGKPSCGQKRTGMMGERQVKAHGRATVEHSLREKQNEEEDRGANDAVFLAPKGGGKN